MGVRVPSQRQLYIIDVMAWAGAEKPIKKAAGRSQIMMFPQIKYKSVVNNKDTEEQEIGHQQC